MGFVKRSLFLLSVQKLWSSNREHTGLGPCACGGSFLDKSAGLGFCPGGRGKLIFYFCQAFKPLCCNTWLTVSCCFISFSSMWLNL